MVRQHRSRSPGKRPPTACRHTVSGTISLPSQGFFSPFPHGTGSLSVAGTYLALGDGPPRFPQGSTCPAVLRYQTRKPFSFHLRGYHPVSPTFPDRSVRRLVSHSPVRLQPHHVRPYNTLDATPAGLHIKGLGCSLFARRYWGNRICFLFLRVLRWFTSPGRPRHPMYSDDVLEGYSRGCPIRKSPGQSLFATHRSFSQLTASFIAVLRQGIHRTPLVA